MKQFEDAIHEIASEVPGLDRGGPARTINHLDPTIDAHGKLASIDRNIGEWAKRNLARVTSCPDAAGEGVVFPGPTD